MQELFNSIIYTFGSASALKTIISYEHRRSGTDMQYRFNYQIFVSNRSGTHSNTGYYSNNLRATFTLNGSNVWVKDTKSASAGWSFNETSDWITVPNKITGSTSFKFSVKDTQNSSWCNYNSTTFNLVVDPAGNDLQFINNFNIGESFTINITKYSNNLYDI